MSQYRSELERYLLTYVTILLDCERGSERDNSPMFDHPKFSSSVFYLDGCQQNQN